MKGLSEARDSEIPYYPPSDIERGPNDRHGPPRRFIFDPSIWHLFGLAGIFSLIVLLSSGSQTPTTPPAAYGASPKMLDSGSHSFKSDKRGHIALLFSGTARSFSVNWEPVIVNLMLGSPYTVHVFFHTFSSDARWPFSTTGRPNYESVNATLDYFEGYTNLDNERVLFKDAVKANVLEPISGEKLSEIYPLYDSVKDANYGLGAQDPVPGYFYLWHGQRRVEELREEYSKKTGIQYKHVFRMRHDFTPFTNWWQQAFDIQPYTAAPSQQALDDDYGPGWGLEPTRLYDMVYTPRLDLTETIYAPDGWKWGGINDQFAVMGEKAANFYFNRVHHITEMLQGISMPLGRKGLHAESSVAWVGNFYNLTMDTTTASICYDIIRAIPPLVPDGTKNAECAYKTSGTSDCQIQCPQYEAMNAKLGQHFESLQPEVGSPKSDLSPARYAAALKSRYSRLAGLTASSSSYYYLWEWAKGYSNKRCLPKTWTEDQGNQMANLNLPLVLRSSDPTVIAAYNERVTCGDPVV